MILKRIESVAADEGYTFTAVLEQNGKLMRVPVTATALMHYCVFVNEVLRATGRLYEYVCAGGRVPHEADYFWRSLVDAALMEVTPKATVGMVN